MLKSVDYTLILLVISYIYLLLFSKLKNKHSNSYFMYLNLLFFVLTIIIIYFSFYLSITDTKKKAVKNINNYLKNKKKEYISKYDPKSTTNIEYLAPRNLSHIPIYYINMDKSIDRNISMLKEFQRYGITNFHRVRAIDSKKLLKGKEELVFTDSSKNTTMNELATTLSHMKAINSAFLDGNKYAVIIEDDMTFALVPFWKESLIEIIDKLPKDWAILNISHLNCNVDGNNLTDHREKRCHSTGAYLINEKGMENISKYIDTDSKIPHYYITPEKNELFLADGSADIYIYNLTDGVYYYHTPLFFERPEGSTIHNDHEMGNLLKTVSRLSSLD